MDVINYKFNFANLEILFCVSQAVGRAKFVVITVELFLFFFYYFIAFLKSV